MARSVIDIIFQAVDKASGTADKIGNAVDNINNKSGVSIGKAAALGAAFAGAFAAVQVAADLASKSFEFIGTRISEASQANQDMISTAGMLQGILGVSFDSASQTVDKLGDSIFKATNALPGVTKEYDELANSIIDNLIPAAKNAEGILDTNKLISVTTDLTKSFGLIGKNAGLQRSDVTLGLSRAIGGGSMSELRNLGLFERNPALMNQIRSELTKRGVEELKDVDEKTRIEILRKVGGTLVSPETLAKLTNTLDARIEGLMGTLFDPKRGMFGFLRKLDDRGGKNVLDAVTQAFDAVMGIFETIGEIAENLGFDSFSALELIFDFFTSIASIANSISGAIDVNAIASYIQYLMGMFRNIQEAANRVIEGDLAAAIDIGLYAQMLGENWANGIMNWIASINWADLLVGLGRISIAVLAFVTNLVASFAATLNERVAEIYQGAANTLVYGLKGILETVVEAVLNGIRSALDAVNSFIASIPSMVQSAISNATSSIGNAVTGQNNMSGNTYSSIGGDTFYVTIQTSSNPNNVGSFADELVRVLDQKWTQYKGSRFSISGVGA